MAAGWMLGSWAAAFLVVRLVSKVLLKVTARTATTLDERLISAVRRPLVWMIVLLGIRAGVDHLEETVARGMAKIPDGIVFFDTRLFPVLMIIAGAYLADRVIHAVLDWYLHELAGKTNSTWDEFVLPLAKRVTTVAVVFIALSMILPKFGLDITALITTAGVASFAVAFASQETLANMIAGFTILVDRPFKVGDIVELDGDRVGEVVEIGMRSTKIKQFDGNALVIPNKDIAATRLVNFSLPDPRRAVREKITISYSSDVEHAKRVVLECLQAQEEIMADPEPIVVLLGFGDSAIELYAIGWVDHWSKWFTTKEKFLMTVWRRFKEEGIEIPFPQRDVHLYYHNPPPKE